MLGVRNCAELQQVEAIKARKAREGDRERREALEFGDGDGHQQFVAVAVVPVQANPQMGLWPRRALLLTQDGGVGAQSGRDCDAGAARLRRCVGGVSIPCGDFVCALAVVVSARHSRGGAQGGPQRFES